MARGGAREGAGRPIQAEVMKADSIPMGIATDYADGVSFLLDVLNLRFDRLGLSKITSTDRMRAAIELLPYTNQAKPKLVEAKHDHSWAERVREAEARHTQRQTAAEAAAETVAEEAAADAKRSPAD